MNEHIKRKKAAWAYVLTSISRCCFSGYEANYLKDKAADQNLVCRFND